MKVRLDTQRCQGHALCFMAAPDIFQLSDEDGHAYLVVEEVPPGQEQLARDAYMGCPERAIELDE